MSGANREAIVTRDLGWPNGLTLDIANYKMYWADAKLDKVGHCL